MKLYSPMYKTPREQAETVSIHRLLGHIQTLSDQLAAPIDIYLVKTTRSELTTRFIALQHQIAIEINRLKGSGR